VSFFFLDIYFDCVEQLGDDQQLVEICPKYQPWISEIRLSVYRKYRRIFLFFEINLREI
jgi:hypothetical protein